MFAAGYAAYALWAMAAASAVAGYAQYQQTKTANQIAADQAQTAQEALTQKKNQEALAATEEASAKTTEITTSDAALGLNKTKAMRGADITIGL